MQTKNLTLIEADFNVWEAILKGNKVLSQVLGINVPKRWSEFSDHFPAFAEQVKKDPTLDTWGSRLIVHTADNLLIGMCGFKGKPSPEGVVEIGYEIKDTYRGRGLATEAAAALVAFAFAQAEVQTVTAHTLPQENASTKVLTKLGFVHTGTVQDPDDGEVWHWKLPRSS